MNTRESVTFSELMGRKGLMRLFIWRLWYNRTVIWY